MTKAEEIFNVKAEYNKWLKELTYDEKDLVIEMINEAFLQCNVSAQSEQFYCTCSRAKGLDYDEDGTLYCISCQKEVQ